MSINKQEQGIISDIRLKHGDVDVYAPIIRWDEFEVIAAALGAAEKRIAELKARDINIKRQAQALFEAIANPNDCYIPAYVRCLREALNGNSTGIGVKGE